MTVRTFLRNGARILLLGVVATCTDQRNTDPLATGPLAITPQIVPVIAPTLLTAGQSLANQKVYTTGSISPAPNTLVLVGVMGIRTFGASPSPTVTGGGMSTWTEVASVVFDSIPFVQRRMTVYRAMSATPASGPITITFNGNQSNAQWIVVQWDGVDRSGVNGAGAIGQTGSNLGDVVDGLSVSLAPFANSGNVAFGVFGARSGIHGLPLINPGAGFTELSEQLSQESTPSDFQAEWATNLNTVNATWTDLFGGALAIEIIVAQPEPDPVASVTVDPATADVNVGATVQLAATPRDANGNPLAGRVVTWASSDPDVATVSATGLVSGVAGGAVTITATSEGQSGSAAVTVRIPVATVDVTPATATLDVAATLQLTATPKDAAGNALTGRDVIWTSSDLDVATVSETGLVTGAGAGTVTITAESEEKTGTASLTVRVVPAFSHTLLTFGTNPANLRVYTTASIAPAPRTLITVAVLEYSSMGTPPIPVLTGGGMAAWDVVATTVFDNLAFPVQRLTIFRAMSEDPGSGPITITSPTIALSHAHWSVSQWTGVAQGGVNGAGAVRQTGAAQADRVSGLVIPLEPFASPFNVTFATFGVQIRTTDVTPGEGFTEISEQASGESTPGDLQTQWGTNLTNPSVTWPPFDPNRNGGGLAIEINTTSLPGSGPAPVGSVTVEPPTASVNVGATAQLTATARDVNGNPLTGRIVTWTSSDLTRATVSSTGLVSGVSAGVATITATSEGQSGTSAVTVTLAPVASVTVTPSTPSVIVGATVQLTATLQDANGNPLIGRVVTWTSSDLTRATVSTTGLVTGMGVGPVTITATSEGQNGTSAVTVTPPPVASVTVTPNPGSVNVGATLQLTATPKDANGNALTGRVVTWASGDLTRATVSSAGLVTGVGTGPVTITATSEGQNGTSVVTVNPAPVATVTVAPNPGSVGVGATLQLTATPRDANGNALTGRVVTWTSSDLTRATVSSSGLVTGVGVGSVTITATSEGHSGTSSVTVTPPPVASVTVAPTSPSVSVGATVQLTATLRDANGNLLTGRVVTWASGDVTRATVSATGLVTAVGAGPVTITATSEGQNGTSTVTVSLIPVAVVTVAPPTGSVGVGLTLQLTATARDGNGDPLPGRVVTWTSSNLTRATVSATGLVTGVATGVVTITATSEGQFATAAVTVTPAPVASVTVAPSSPSISVAGTVQLTATPRDANGNALTGRVVTWTSSDLTRATVSATGLVTGVAAGSATITATSEGQSGTSAVTITPLPVASVTVTPNPGSVNVGATLQLTATPRDVNGNALTGRVVTWSSNNLTRATVSSTGLVSGVGAGAVTITATSEGQNGTSAVTVNLVPVATVTVTPNPGSVNVGATLQLTATPRDANGDALNGRVVTWTSSDLTRATVSSAGLVSGVAAGAVTITATSEGQAGTSAVTVTLVPVATVTVTPNPGSVNVGATLQLTATPKDANGNTLTGRVVTWTSSDLTRATVSSSGLVSGVAAGTVTITATSEGQAGTSAVTVASTSVPVASVAVTPANATLGIGGTVQLTATPKDANGNALTGRSVAWASTNLGAANVSGTGLVTAAGVGSTTITATSEGQVGTANVTVTEAVVFVGAGDISECSNNFDEATAKLLDGYPGPVFTVGDNVYDRGTATEFANCYNPTWGRHKARTYPSAGNHDYDDPAGNAAGYYAYFGAAAGDPTKGYYSFDLGAWHVVVLNSELPRTAVSPQVQWLVADLAASTKQCQMAIWHHPLWTNDASRSTNNSIKPFWDALWTAGVELVLNGHDHHYVRYAPQNAKGGVEPNGIRQITVGTGGATPLYTLSSTVRSNAEVRNATAHGVLELTLRAGDYDWRFVPIAGDVFTDGGTGTCVGPRPAPANQLPTARPGGPYQSEDSVAFDGRSSSDPDGDTPLTYAWTFGDGGIGTGAQPSHTYANPGVYTVTLVVTDALGGQSALATTTATITNVAPTVNAGPDAAVGLGQPFSLQAGISDPGLHDGPWTYVINWGDGATESGSAATQSATAISATHTYAAAGQYTATVTVTDKDGGTGSDAVTTIVTLVPPATIVQTLLTTGNSTANQQVYTTAAFAPGANALITVSVLDVSTLQTPPTPTLSGGGMAAWDVVGTVTFDGGTRRLTVFRAMSAQPGNGPLTIRSTVTLSNMQWIVSQWDGVDVSGLNGAGAVRQTGSASAAGVNGLTVPLNPFEHPNNVAFGAFGVTKNEFAVTPGAGFTEIAEVPSAENSTGDLQAQWAKNLPSIGATWANLTAGALGIEIKVRP